MKEFLSRMIPYYRPYRAAVLLGLLFVALANGARSLGPWLMRIAVNGLETGDFTRGDLWLWAGYIVAAAAGAGIFTLLMRYFVIGASRRVEYDLRRNIMDHLFALEPAFYDRSRVGDLMTRATSDVEQVRMVIGPALMYTVNTIFGLVFALSLMMAISVKLTLIVIAVGPFIAGVVFFLSKKIHAATHRSQEAYSDLSAAVQENVSGIRVVKAFRREAHQKSFFDDRSTTLRQRALKLVYLRGVFMPAVVLVFGAAVAVILLIGGRQIIRGELQVGDFVAFVSYLMMLTWPMISIGWVVSLFQRGRASLERIASILDREPELLDRQQPVRRPEEEGRVRFNDVTFTYPLAEAPALRGISFEIAQGRSLGVVGRVGAGKSTIAHLLTRLYEPGEGRIELEGVEVRDWALKALRDRIGLVPQDPLLFSTTLRENITLGRDYGEEEVDRAVKISRLVQDLDDFPDGLETAVGERGLTLSGGQKQRVAIARAVIRRPQVLIFDDALSAVDADTEERILEGLETFLEGRTSIIISHRITSVQNADEIIVLEDGAVVERGHHDELVKSGGHYSDIFQQQKLARELEEVA